MNRNVLLRTPVARQRQRGISLLVVLILLVVMSILGLAVLRSSAMQERMSANMVDRNEATGMQVFDPFADRWHDDLLARAGLPRAALPRPVPATEAAGVAALYTFILGKFLYKSLSWKGLVKATLDASVGTAVVMLMVGVSMTMSWLLASTGSAKMLADAIIGVSDNPYVLMGLFNVLLLLLGTFLDITPGLLIFTPIFLPVAMKLGISPVHFGIIITFNLCIGIATPPVGSTLFVAARVARVPLAELTRPLLPMFALEILALFLITYFPVLSLWLPELILGKVS